MGSVCWAKRMRTESLTIEVLYLGGCPHRSIAVERVCEALQQEAMAAEVVEVEVEDFDCGQVEGFLGSPTIRINGQDIEPSARGTGVCGVSCRTYTDKGQRLGAPPLEWIQTALREAHQGGRR